MTTVPRDDLRAAFEARLFSALPGTPIEIENVKFIQPKGALWTSCWLQFTGSKRASIGTQKQFDRHTGFWCVDIFQPEDKGTKAVLDIAAAIESAFSNISITLPSNGFAVCLVTKLVNGPIQDGFLSKTCMVPFYLDACTP